MALVASEARYGKHVSFEYRATVSPVPFAARVGLAIVGAILTVGCAIWLFGPTVAASGDRTTAGTVVSWDLVPAVAAGSTGGWTPEISYSVGGTAYRFHSPLEVQSSDARAHPAGSAVTVSYDPNTPSHAQWIPTGSTIAVNVAAVVGLLVGILLLVVAAIFAIIAVRQRKRTTA
jgi:hypothetical protein